MASRKHNSPERSPGTPTRRRGHGHAHNEELPTRRLVIAEAARSIAVALLIGCCVALVLVAITMLVAAAVAPEPVRAAMDRVGLGIVAASAIGILVLALVSGFIATAARIALAAFYGGVGPKPERLPDTVLVRGQASPTPYDPALASTVTLASVSLLAAVPCIVLASEHAGRLDDEIHRSAFDQWAFWAGLFLAVTAACGAASWGFTRLNRRWRDAVGSRLPTGAVGHRGPATRITTRAERRVERRSWRAPEWTAWAGRVALAAGACLVFLGVYLRQPGLYADPVSYSPAVERVIDAGTPVGGILLGLGLLVVFGTGVLACARTILALRQLHTGPTPISADDRVRVRTATTTLSNAVTAALIWWAVCGVVAIGWGFGNQFLLTTDDTIVPISSPATTALVLGWAVLGVLLIAARIALERTAPIVRNRFGYRLPGEPNDREFPDLQLFGQ